MINNISVETIVSGTFSISWMYKGVTNKVVVGSFDTRDKILNMLIRAQTDKVEAPKIIKEIKYIKAKR